MTRPRDKKRKKKIILIILLIFVFLILAAAIAVMILFNRFYSMTNFDAGIIYEEPSGNDIEAQGEAQEPGQTQSGDRKTNQSGNVVLPAEVPAEVLETLETVDVEVAESIRESMEAAIEEAMKKIEEEESTVEAEKDGIFNLLLIGCDRRDTSWYGNSDVMMLVSINYSTKKVMITSLMRDTGVQIEGYGLCRLNSAFAIAGAPLLVSTVEKNFGVAIDNYAWVDFVGVETIIDNLGGVDLPLTVAEAKVAGIEIASDQVVHLNGKQALTHARDRSSFGNDYQRTQRQRNIIMALLNKIRSGSLGDIMRVAECILPYITHNMTRTDLLSFLFDASSVINYEFNQQRIPYDGTYYEQNYILIPDMGITIQRLHESINN